MATPLALSCTAASLAPSSPLPASAAAGAYTGAVSSPPFIELLYFHKAIRAELERLHQDALAVEDGSEREVRALVDRYCFLLSIYKHHSRIEDEVIFPALDARVKNVASTYSLEHQVATDLFDQMSQLLAAALKEKGNVATSLRRELICCTEAIQTTLCQHLSKEEEHVFPLLFRHFDYGEQAALVWQFICSFPVNLMEKFLPWLASSLSLEEREDMVACMQEIVPREELLQQVVSTWLKGGSMATDFRNAGGAEYLAVCPGKLPDWIKGSLNESTDENLQIRKQDPQSCKQDGCQRSMNGCLTKSMQLNSGDSDKDSENGSGCLNLPINELLHWHNAIRKELQEFVEEAHNIQTCEVISPSTWSSFVERLQFLADVCIFHSAAEDEVVFPAVGLKLKEHVSYVTEHAKEEQQFDDARKLIEDFQIAGHGSPHAYSIHKKLCAQAEHIVATVQQHLLNEEAEILPLARKYCSVEEQRVLLYKSLRVMPLKFLERVLPWLVAVLTEDEAKEMLCNMQLAAPDADRALVTLFAGWACKGQLRTTFGSRPFRCLSSCSMHCCPVPKVVQSGKVQGKPHESGLGIISSEDTSEDSLEWRPLKRARKERLEGIQDEALCSSMKAACQGQENVQVVKHVCHVPELGVSSIRGNSVARTIGSSCRTVLHDGLQCKTSGSLGSSLFGWGTTRGPNPKPIDHIFQFHKAIRKDLEYLDLESAKLSDCDDEFLRQFSGRFRFLQGLYRAHSNAEDEIVFPALEAKEALHNISHSYTIDHKQEEQLFAGISQVISELLDLNSKSRGDAGVATDQCGDTKNQFKAGKRREIASKLQRMCKSVRVSLDQHVSREEVELWPLFDVHFTIEEQNKIIGRIIGTTGAEVLQAMIPWVTTALTEEEQNTMLSTWRQATRNTMFDKWLSAWWKESPDLSSAATVSPSSNDPFPPSGTSESLQMVVDYLGMKDEVTSELDGLQLDKSHVQLSEDTVSGGHDKEPKHCDSETNAVVSLENKDSEKFRPGWQSIFRMNQMEVEAAIRKVSSDSTLDPRQKSYLIQNLMTSRWIVAQQQLTQSQEEKGFNGLNDVPGRVMSFHDEKAGVFGCEHYKRNCKLRAACCGSLFTCRFCHDKVSDHTMDRHATVEVMCMKCMEIQPVSQNCITPSCNGQSLARYFCSICKFYDDADRDIYHCPSCNLCRVGKGLGIDFFHCMTCNSCMSKDLTDHKCREKGLESNCPICHDFLFTSSSPVKALPCGHFMHSACFQAYTCSNYTCPICSKSLGDMAVYFGMLDALLATEQLPDEYRHRMQQILCNDCEQKGAARFHWLYHKCGGCGSYNTRVT